VVQCDGTVRKAINEVVELTYGGDGLAKMRESVFNLASVSWKKSKKILNFY
jgi:hypothetical protein